LRFKAASPGPNSLQQQDRFDAFVHEFNMEQGTAAFRSHDQRLYGRLRVR
jgi:hypothetical protein